MGTIATFACDDGYELEGPRTRTCASSGNWDSSSPTCNKQGNLLCKNLSVCLSVSVPIVSYFNHLSVEDDVIPPYR